MSSKEILKQLEEPVENYQRYTYLFTSDQVWADEIIQQLNYFNYSVRVFNQWADFKEAATLILPAAILIDIKSLNKQVTDWLVNFKESNVLLPIPIIYFSDEASISVHLNAIRSGGDAFYVKPVDVMSLVAKLDMLSGSKPKEPYRVLIVEDTVALSKYYAFILQKAGIQTETVNNPLNIHEPLVEFKPDIILMDVYMPECSGMELACIIRQQDMFANVPIIYLSSEADKAKQFIAMGLGGDDFLTKPVLPQDLVAVIQRRAKRSRALGSMIIKDSLTGLLKHTAIQEQLHIELMRAQKQSSLLTFAMLDLDHFKNINDSYGHQVGDLVITSLARLFIKRLRRTDIGGRYGGEEFALIFPETNLETATKLCDEIREDFSKLSFKAPDGQMFNATFSAGLATYPTYTTVTAIVSAADGALYKAKQSGRNKVIIA